jgi:hypothetical protein
MLATLTTRSTKKHQTERRCVAVVGLLPGQAARVDRAINGRLKIHFLPADRRPRIPSSCEDVILVTKFIGHDWQTKALATRSRETVYRHHGGISGLIEGLQRLADGHGFRPPP